MPSNRIVLFNQLFLEMYGLSPTTSSGSASRCATSSTRRRSADTFPMRRRERVWQRRLEKMAPRKPFQQYQNLRSGNEYILHYHPMQDGGWVTLCEDVTERHRMERELRLQFERFDQAINHMSHGLCMFGPDERLIVCNAQYLEIYGLDPAVIKPGVTLARTARALDRERQRARNVRRGVLREAQGRGHRQRRLDHAAAPEERARDRGRRRARRPTAAGCRRTRTSPSGWATRRRCASRTSCSMPRWRTWRTALCMFDKDWRDRRAQPALS